MRPTLALGSILSGILTGSQHVEGGVKSGMGKVWCITIRLGIVTATLGLFSSVAMGQYPVPSNAPVGYPNWWFQSGVIPQTSPTNSSPSWPTNYSTRSDYSAINQGQLKNIAANALAELQATLPSAVLSTSEATYLQSLINAWSTNTNADPYAIVNQGQLKTVAQGFYNLLADAKYTAGIATNPIGWTSGTYPWTTNTSPADDYTAANIGEAKYLFSFDLTVPTNQVPSWWTDYYLGLTNVNPTNLLPVGNGLTFLQAYQQGANPSNFYSLSAYYTIAPILVIISGNNQIAAPGSFTALPLVVQVTWDGSTPITNAPLAFSATGTGVIATATNAGTYTTINLLTDSNGLAQVYAQMPNPATNFTVTTTATGSSGPQSLAFNVLQQITPTNIPGMKLWLNASAGVTTSNGIVTSWVDQSTNHFNLAQNNIGTQPAFTNSDINSNPAIRFSGSQLLTNGAQVDNGFNGGLTMITIASTTIPRTTQYSMYLGGSNGGDGRGMGYSSAQETVDFYGFNSIGEGATNANTFVAEMATLSTNLSTLTFYQNGAQTTQDAVSGITNISSGIYIGANNTNNGVYTWQGDIAEVLVYDHPLTTNEMVQLNQYINNKYGIYAPNAAWISRYTDAMQVIINQYKLNKPQADQCNSWILSYTAPQQAEITLHHWNQSQASNYAALQTNYSSTLPTAGLSMWFEAGAGVTSSNNIVSKWVDQTGNYSVSQTNTNSEPAYVTNDINSNPALRFNGSQILAATNQVDSGFNEGLTFVTVATTTSRNGYTIYFGGSSLHSDGRGVGYSSGEEAFDYYYNSLSGGAAPNTNTFTAEVTVLSTNSTNISTATFYQNGTQSGPTPLSYPIYNITPGIELGGNTNGASWQGDIAEVLVYDHPLSASEMGQLNLYLANKYGFYSPNATWINTYPSAMQSLINQYQLNQTQAAQYNSWSPSITNYTASQQVEIFKHQWTQAQASNYATYTSNYPSLPAGLSLWFKANTGVISTNGSVTNWTDSIGGFSISSSGTNAPAYITNDINSNPALRFNGGQMLFGGGQVDASLNADLTIITVASTTNRNAQQESFEVGGYGGWRGIGYDIATEASDISGTFMNGGAAPSTNSFVMEATSLDRMLQNVYFYQNGYQTAQDLVSGASSIEAGIYVGASIYGYNWQGDVAEVLVYDHQLSASEMAQVNLYLANKYTTFAPNASWISSYNTNMQSIINQYHLNKAQATQYNSWSPAITSYTPAQQATIFNHQWTQAQATNYVAMQANNTNLPTSGLSVWFKADAGVTTSGTNVTGWSDQTGNYTVTNASGNNPLYVTNVINGKPVVRFSAAGLTNALSTADPALNNDVTIVTVSSTTNGGGDTISLGNWNGDLRAFGQSGSQYFYNTATTTTGATTPNSGPATINAVELGASFNILSFYSNGSLVANGSIYGLTPLNSGICVGSDPNGSTVWQGDIAEILVYDHQLSAFEMQRLSMYLGGKYGISVPVTCPIITPPGASVAATSSISVSITGATLPNVVRYTVNGSQPLPTSSLYTTNIIVTNDLQLSAAIFDTNGVMVGSVSSAQFYVGDTYQIGISDAWQTNYFGSVSYLNVNAPVPGGSGLTYLQAYYWGYNPNAYSSSGDGVSDFINYSLGYAATNTDINGDGLSNAQDVALGLNPFFTNPNYTSAPTPNPLDTNVTTITVTQPLGATNVAGH